MSATLPYRYRRSDELSYTYTRGQDVVGYIYARQDQWPESLVRIYRRPEDRVHYRYRRGKA